MNYLIDSNVFLEILLPQDQKEKAKTFLTQNIDYLFLSDFSLHSIGVFLFREKHESTFKEFIEDVVPHLQIISLPENRYAEVLKIHQAYKPDFDDSYQLSLANDFDLTVVTFDHDFQKVKTRHKIQLL